MPQKKEKVESWLRQRGYRHFDVPFPRDNTEFLAADQISKHSFFPFIGKTKVVLRYKKEERRVVSKPRELKYASHRDSAIFAYYSAQLAIHYEAAIAKRGLAESVLAYRSLPGSPCNIHHAKNAFLEIERLGSCDVIATDVQDFFDSLVHDTIKQWWQEILGVERLASDHFAVYKQITKYRWVELEEVASALNLSKSGLAPKSGAGKKRLRLSDMDRLRIVLKQPGVVKANNESKGIPQGSPISALISNVYMLGVDSTLSDYAREVGGAYRRYSDDILIIVPAGKLTEAKGVLTDALESVGLACHPKKTSEILVRRENGAITVTEPLDYLGFTFDGKSIKLRDRTVSCFLQRMIRAVKRAYRATKSKGEVKLRKFKLYENYSHKGKKNFLAYAKRASKIMYPDATERTPIEHQIRNHWKILHKYIAMAEQKLGAKN